ncbi:MAG: carbohydrate porin [Tardiphaga sp.]
MFRSKAFVVALLLAVAPSQAMAQESNEDQPPDPDTGESTITERTLGLLPNPIEKQGVKFAATYIGEVMGNASGGLKQGTFLQGRLNLAADLDFNKLAGWSGLTMHANIFAIHGDGLSRSNLQNFMVTSGIEALPAVRLYEAYFEQKFLHDKWSVRFGQLAADSEFIATKYTDVFTNASLGWPAITSVNLPAGGPSPPLAAMGVRLYGQLSDHVTWLAAVFDGNSAGPGADDPQLRNSNGLNFRVNDPPLVISELQYAWKDGGGVPHLPGTLKLGGWQHFGGFDDPHFADDNHSLADPQASGTPRQFAGDSGLYAVVEQRLYTVPDHDDRGVGVFLRASQSPSDRNLIDRYADAGIDLLGLWDSRPNDKFGVALGYAHVSKAARALDLDFRALNGPAWPVRSSETMVTVAYQYEVRGGWNLVPNLQYILHPGGGATDPRGATPGLRLHDAFVAGLRSVAKF